MAIGGRHGDPEEQTMMVSIPSHCGRGSGRSHRAWCLGMVALSGQRQHSILRLRLPPPVAPLPAAVAGAQSPAVAVDGPLLIAAVAREVPVVVASDGHPSHWLAAPTDRDVHARYTEVRDAISAAASLPFRAGSLTCDRILRTLRRRAPHLDHDLPLPLPLTLSSVLALDSGALEDSLVRCRGGSAILQDIMKAMDCGALIDAGGPLTHVSPMFSITQTDKSRLIFDLRTLNGHMSTFPFRLETIIDLPALAHGCRYASKLDLQSAYWQYPVDEPLSRALGTSCPELPGRPLRWICLPFGLSVAPFAFASLTHAFVRAWRACGIVVTAYLDDILVMARTVEEHFRAVSIVVGDLMAAGLRISPPKAFILPYTRLDYLGITVDFHAEAFAIPASYTSKVLDDVRSILAASNVRGITSEGTRATVGVPRIQRLLGRIAFLGLVIPWVSCFRAHLTGLISGTPQPARVAINDGSREELEWWLSAQAAEILARSWPWFSIAHTKLYFRKLDAPRPQFAVHGDASETGIGMRLTCGKIVSEPLPPELPPTAPSVARELYAMCRLIERDAFPRGAVIRLVSDATGAVRTALGATVAPATAPWARRLFLAALRRDVVVQVEWVPRAALTEVDAASRWDAADGSHARLPLGVVHALVHRAFGPGGIDIEFFAAVHNRVAPAGATVLTKDPHPFSAGDGLCPSFWSRAMRGWAFPPFCLVRPVLRLAVLLRPRVIIVLPDTSLVRCTLREWTHVPIDAPLAPPDFVRPMFGCQRIAAFLPPLPPQGPSAGSPSGTPGQ